MSAGRCATTSRVDGGAHPPFGHPPSGGLAGGPWVAEAATNSAIVGSDNDAGDAVVARLPLNGGPLSLVDRGRFADAGPYRAH